MLGDFLSDIEFKLDVISSLDSTQINFIREFLVIQHKPRKWLQSGSSIEASFEFSKSLQNFAKKTKSWGRFVPKKCVFAAGFGVHWVLKSKGAFVKDSTTVRCLCIPWPVVLINHRSPRPRPSGGLPDPREKYLGRKRSAKRNLIYVHQISRTVWKSAWTCRYTSSWTSTVLDSRSARKEFRSIACMTIILSGTPK